MIRSLFYLTDFGTRDPYVGIMKAVVANIFPAIPQIDLTHEIKSQSIQSGIIALQDSWRWLPADSVVCAVIDPGVGSTREAIMIELDNLTIIAPDNGLGIFEDLEEWCKVRISKIDIKSMKLIQKICTEMRSQNSVGILEYKELIQSEFKKRILNYSDHQNYTDNLSNTFHGRDIFAPAAGCVALGLTGLIRGEGVSKPVELQMSQPVFDGDRIEAEIVSIDHFGNLSTNFRGKDFDKVAQFDSVKWVVCIGEKKINGLSKTYSDVSEGEPIAYQSSFGRLELGIRNGSAEKYFEAAIGTKVQIRFD